MTLKVGDTIYKFDPNRRVYPRDEDGNATGGPTFAGHFKDYPIIGETPRSWLIVAGWAQEKINKKTMRTAMKNGFSGHQFYTKEGMEARIWEMESRRKIINYLECKADVATLREVAELLGSRLGT